MLSIFPAPLSFPKNFAFSWCARNRTASVLSFSLPAMFQALLVVQDIRRALLQYHMNQCFPISLLHCSIFAFIHSNYRTMSVNDLSLGLSGHMLALDDLNDPFATFECQASLNFLATIFIWSNNWSRWSKSLPIDIFSIIWMDWWSWTATLKPLS